MLLVLFRAGPLWPQEEVPPTLSSEELELTRPHQAKIIPLDCHC